MKCPACSNEQLAEKLTTAGVVVDQCEFCSGVWLDQGEIFLFSKDPMKLNEYLNQCFSGAGVTDRHCPHCNEELREGSLFRPDLLIDYCPKCVGMWFDQGELAQAVGENPKRFSMKFDSSPATPRTSWEPSKEKVTKASKVDLKKRRFERGAAVAAEQMSALPNLFLRAAGAMGFLYTLLALVLIIVMEYFGLSPNIILIFGIGSVFLQFLISPFIMDLSLRWLYRCSWISFDELPEHLLVFVERVTSGQGMKVPSFGIIDDGAPNAFTYGHTPNNARVVITRGLMNLLDEEELEAVVAHEIGHARHWDILLMTVAALVPLLLYYVFRVISNAASRMSRSKGSKDSGNAGAMVYAVAAGVYVAYILAQYVVLWFSRTREFHADRFSGKVTKNPNFLSSALVKIAYGLTGQREESEEQKKRSGYLEAVGSMGIFDPGAARALAFSAYGLTAQAARQTEGGEATLGAMQWDMWNPWAKWYELHSTHPLVANRLNYLGEQAAALGWEPFVVFNLKKPESYWDEFFVDFLIYIFPSLTAIGAAVGGFITKDYWIWLGAGLLAVGYTGLLKIAFRYRGKVFPLMNVAGLLRKIKVSMIRPVPVTLRGRVIGKGVPGLIWSEDFVMQDDSGIILLDYSQPLAVWEWIFGLLKAGDYAGQNVEVKGWYRRSPVPYVEIRTITNSDTARRCYTLEGKIVTSLAMMVAGAVIAGSMVFPYLRGLFLF